ncbi:sigma-70 family RNA polymerase sigma factor [Salinimicrobium sp. MT39]|uniref:Sigma-70 family RNA polymerase sigma factor n=1 Tax=Salinimicrobium profundisediminis TaxID=2994553 RepID=A0A9X3CWB3_9FLAO|nr:sigma-70 family RNA polymerase sigma factor [Salinimicrobium profundisediminis]MCX2837869.1 sigma-70 family RNA polymerase sigma factor [Salinimicrobium profundisediminis]
MSHDNFELLKQGHPDALEFIYSKYHRRIFWVGKQLISDEFVIETILQDTFLKLWEKREDIERPEHIYFFLRYVMKRECTYYYCRPKNDFYRNINRLENYEDYQKYMHGYDPQKEDEHLSDQQADQKALNRINSVLPLLSDKRKHLIELCLKYGFQYKAIADAMGISIKEVSIEVKKAIQEIKNFIYQGTDLEAKNQPATTIKVEGSMTEEQEKVLQLRSEKNYSFAAIATELSLSQKEVHKIFIAAYKFLEEKHQEQLQSA